MKKRRANRDTAALNSELIRRPIQRWFPLFLLPTFAAFCIGFLYPFCKGLFLSFCKFKLTSHWTWVGFDNYLRIFKDGGFVHAFWYTALFALVSLVIINVFAFMVAYALTQGIKGSNLFRTVFFMPNLIGGIVLGYIWSTLIDGVLIRFGTALALNTKAGFWGLIILLSWQQIGYMMIIYIAGLQAVPEDMLEAARIDGANQFRQLVNITIPLLRPIILVTAIMSTNGTLQLFDESVNLTRGGPANMTITMSHYIYNTMFTKNPNFGYAAAMSFVILIMVAILSAIQTKVGDKR